MVLVNQAFHFYRTYNFLSNYITIVLTKKHKNSEKIYISDWKDVYLLKKQIKPLWQYNQKLKWQNRRGI